MSKKDTELNLSLAEKNVASHHKESHYFKILLIVGGVILIILQIMAYTGAAKRAELLGFSTSPSFTFNSMGIAFLLGYNIIGIAGVVSVILGIVALIREKNQPKQ